MQKSRFQLPGSLLRLIAVCLLKSFYTFKIQGLEHIKAQSGGFILAGNHTGYLDSLLVYATLNRDFSFLMTEEVFNWKFIGQLVRYGNIIPLYQGKEKRVLAESLKLLKQGHPLCIFPEGCLTQTGQLNPFQEGVAFLQERSQVPIIPFAIQGGFQAWPYGSPWPTIKRLQLQIIIGPAMPYNANQNRQSITEALFQQVSALSQWQPGKPAGIHQPATQNLTP